MAVFRLEHNRGYTVMSNHHLRKRIFSPKRNRKRRKNGLHTTGSGKRNGERIGKRYGRTHSTAGRHIYLDLRRLREEMEVLAHEQTSKRSTPSLPIMPDLSTITPIFTDIITWIWRTT